MDEDARQPQLALDSPLRGKVKSDKNIMDYPFFDLSRNGQRKKPLVFNEGGIYVEIRAGSSGMATMYDKDLLLYVGSLMIEQLNRGETPPKTFTFSAYDFLRVARRDTSARSYQNLEKAFARLQGTQIKTNIEVNGEGVDGYFSWVENAHLAYTRDSKDRKRLKAVRVTLCDWLYKAILDKRVLTYHPDYFKLRPLERRLYDLARSYCGNQAYWPIGLEKLYRKSGYDGDLRRFKYELKRIQQETELPEYDFRIINDESDPLYQALRKQGYRLNASGRHQLANMLVAFVPRARVAPRDLSELRASLTY